MSVFVFSNTFIPPIISSPTVSNPHPNNNQLQSSPVPLLKKYSPSYQARLSIYLLNKGYLDLFESDDYSKLFVYLLHAQDRALLFFLPTSKTTYLVVLATKPVKVERVPDQNLFFLPLMPLVLELANPTNVPR